MRDSAPKSNKGSAKTRSAFARYSNRAGVAAKSGVEIVPRADLQARVIYGGAGNSLIEFLDAQNQVTHSAYFPEMSEVMCFTPNTQIMTPQGPVAAGALRAGDLVVTRDNGALPLAWIGRKTLSASSMIANPAQAPVTIAAGSLGNGCPEHDLVVSPNHRILIRGRLNRLTFQADESLISAQDLLDREGISQGIPNTVTYLHLMLERHELILAEGAWAESFQPTKASLQGIESPQKQNLLSLFPTLDSPEGRENFANARPVLRGNNKKSAGSGCI